MLTINRKIDFFETQHLPMLDTLTGSIHLNKIEADSQVHHLNVLHNDNADLWTRLWDSRNVEIVRRIPCAARFWRRRTLPTEAKAAPRGSGSGGDQQE